MNGWELDKKWSDRFLPEMKSILGFYLIGEPPFEEDQERNTDLMVLKMDAVRIGCRIRKLKYIEKYGHEFTIRAGRPNGYKTELTKILEGWGDYFFYGFGDNNCHLQKWILADLNIFRIWYNRQLYNGNHPGLKQNNNDNSSFFLAFEWNDLPKHFVIGKSKQDNQN